MKKSFTSHVTTWMVRILLVIAAMMIVSLLMLSNMGGTSDSHRKGLEQALSESLNADIDIARIDEFNIMPQLSMKAASVHGIFRDTKNEFLADKVQIAFGFWDLISGENKIENFQMDNFRFAADSSYDLQLDHAGINPGEKPEVIARGRYAGKIFSITMPLQQERLARPSYYFGVNNHFAAHFGSLDIEGTAAPQGKGNDKVIQDLKITSAGKSVASREGSRKEGKIEILLNCEKAIPASAKADIKTLSSLKFIKLSESCQK